MPTKEKILYLTFDDGPNGDTTSFILDLLSQYEAKATFFCIGKNIARYPKLFQRMISEGHTLGNHTYNHLNGWKSSIDNYIADVSQCQALYPFKYFRPPYGRLKCNQEHILSAAFSLQPVMWSVLSGDFDVTISGEQCWQHIRDSHILPGDIIVFHDSDKAKERMQLALPKTLAYFSDQGFRFEALPA